MHNYSITNTKIRITAVSTIAIIAAYLTYLLNPLVKILPVEIQPLSPFMVFGVLFYLFDEFIWRAPIIRQLVRIPNFNGSWKGKGKTTYKGSKNKEFEISIVIKQTFTRMIVDARFNSSFSESFVANVDSANPSRDKLVYSYLNKPNATSKVTQNEHFGTVELFCTKRGELRGNYFTNRNPQTKGEISLKKIKCS